MGRDYIITDELYKSIKPQPYKLIKLSYGGTMLLTTLDRLIMDVIDLYLIGQPKKTMTITNIYREVRRVLHYPSLRDYHIKYILMIMTIKKTIKRKHWKINFYLKKVNGNLIKTPCQTCFRDIITLK